CCVAISSGSVPCPDRRGAKTVRPWACRYSPSQRTSSGEAVNPCVQTHPTSPPSSRNGAPPGAMTNRSLVIGCSLAADAPLSVAQRCLAAYHAPGNQQAGRWEILLYSGIHLRTSPPTHIQEDIRYAFFSTPDSFLVDRAVCAACPGFRAGCISLSVVRRSLHPDLGEPRAAHRRDQRRATARLAGRPTGRRL